ncbi:MAG: LLM class F420-dependent oxidoreductase, partial [Nitriliruptorales bacterium]|nr:LLM class F420-dependent oxidoreductase [Nitriliruptorales bacterium]
MRVGMQLQYAGDVVGAADQVAAYEQAGLDVVWVAEAYGFDGVSLMGYLAATTETVAIGSAILNVYSRTPALMAQVAAGLDAVSGGRFELGLGASGPQVIEGWHGLPYAQPVARTREMIELVRRMLRREVIEHGGLFTLPLPAEQGTGLGKPLKMLAHPVRDRIPIHVAALGQKNVEMTAAIADGWMPIFWSPEHAATVHGDALAAGKAKRASELGDLDIITGGMLAIAPDEQTKNALLDFARPMYALYIGGMGAKGRNFYNTLVTNMGWGEEAAKIQDLYLDGKKDEAAAL